MFRVLSQVIWGAAAAGVQAAPRDVASRAHAPLDGPQGALVDAPRWLFLAALVIAPWAYGSTTPASITLLEMLLYTISLLWFAGLLVREDRPRIHPSTLVFALLLLAQGWWMAFNAHYRHDAAQHAFAQAVSAVPWAPGSIDHDASVSMMFRLTALFLGFFVVSDMASLPEWRTRIWWTAGLTGASILLLGLLQKATDAPMIFWESRHATSQFFGTYYYPGNAGAYINLVFPLVAGLALLSMRDENAHLERAVWITTVFLFLAGAAVNFSRAGQVITCILLAIWAVEGVKQVRVNLLPGKAALAVYAGVGVAALAGLILTVGLQRPLQKWDLLQHQFTGENPRVLATRALMRMVPDARWWGLGPGTFAPAFPHYTQSLGWGIAGIWRYAHDDYLQAIVEWGWAGAFLWGMFLFGGVAHCFTGSGARSLPRTDRILLLGAGLALAGAAVHAVVDFPFQIASLQLYEATLLALGWSSGTWSVRAPYDRARDWRNAFRPAPSPATPGRSRAR